jgi:DNA-binding IclR family transcriptional regulator/sugar lactone lactonase YvrE
MDVASPSPRKAGRAARRPRPASSRPEAGDEPEATPAPGTGLVVKALNLIDLIASAPGRYRAQSLADELGLTRSTVYRIIATLQQRGLVRTQGGAYVPGFRFLDYAQAVWPVPDLPLLAMAEMRWLHELTGETVYFGVPGGQEMVIIQTLESRFPVRTAAAPGSRRPLHCTGMGKAHLAALPQAERDALLARLPLEHKTARTIVDPIQLRSQLDVYRLRGYAIDDEEFLEGARCVSAAVPAEGEGSLGAFTVSGPVYRMTPERAHQLGPEVAAAARRLGEAVRRRGQGRARPRPGSVQVPALTEPAAFFGKSPLWDAAGGRLLWLDALAPAVLSLPVPDAGDAQPSMLARFDTPAMALAQVGPGGWFVSTAQDALRVAPDGGTEQWRPALPPGIAAQVTCAVAAPGGGLWLGLGESPGGPHPPGLGWLGPAGFAPGPALACTPTDLAVDAAGEWLYAALSDAGEIARFRLLPGGGLGDPETVSRVDPIHGRPVALVVEDPDWLWVALWDGWSLARMSRRGGDMRLLPLPVPRPTGLAWGGPDGATLFVTSARHGLVPQQIAEAPASGSVFALDARTRAALLR